MSENIDNATKPLAKQLAQAISPEELKAIGGAGGTNGVIHNPTTSSADKGTSEMTSAPGTSTTAIDTVHHA